MIKNINSLICGFNPIVKFSQARETRQFEKLSQHMIAQEKRGKSRDIKEIIAILNTPVLYSSPKHAFWAASEVLYDHPEYAVLAAHAYKRIANQPLVRADRTVLRLIGRAFMENNSIKDSQMALTALNKAIELEQRKPSPEIQFIEAIAVEELWNLRKIPQAKEKFLQIARQSEIPRNLMTFASCLFELGREYETEAFQMLYKALNSEEAIKFHDRTYVGYLLDCILRDSSKYISSEKLKDFCDKLNKETENPNVQPGNELAKLLLKTQAYRIVKKFLD